MSISALAAVEGGFAKVACLGFAGELREDLLEFAEIAFEGFLNEASAMDDSAAIYHPAPLRPSRKRRDADDDPSKRPSTVLRRELAHFIGHLTESHRRQVIFP